MPTSPTSSARGPLRPGRTARRAARGVRPGRAVRADGRRPRSSASRHGRAARALEPRRPREDRPDRRRISPAATTTTSTSRAARSTPAATTSAGRAVITDRQAADGLRARRHRPGDPGQARAAVLVLLRLQRLQQPARGRLGDDPARLRRAATPREALCADAGRGRLQLSTKAPSGPTGATTSSSSSTARHPVVYPAAGSHANNFDDALYLGSSAEAGRRLRRHARARTSSSARSCRRSRATRAAAQRAFPWIAFQGRWGELQKAFFNGPTGPNLKAQWTEPIEWSESWRDRELRGAGRGHPRDERDRLLLHRGRERLARPRSGCSGTRR